MPLFIPPLLSVLQAQQWLHRTNYFRGPRQAAGTGLLWNCVLMAAHFPSITETAISFFPPLHRHPKGHHRRFLLGCDNAMVCFCLCSCEVNTLLFHQRRANSKLPSCSLSSGSASSRAQPTLARHRQAVGGLPVQQLTSLPNSTEPSSVGLGVFVVQDPGLSSKEKTMREVIVLI